MSIALTSVFGSQINVVVQPRLTERVYTGFPAAHGVTTMFMGSRGRQVTVSGRIVTSVTTYALARVAAQVAIDAIEPYAWAPAADYTFNGCIYFAVVWEPLRIISNDKGKAFHYCAPGYIEVDFVMQGRTLI
jgi:hypothetical protein